MALTEITPEFIDKGQKQGLPWLVEKAFKVAKL